MAGWLAGGRAVKVERLAESVLGWDGRDWRVVGSTSTASINGILRVSPGLLPYQLPHNLLQVAASPSQNAGTYIQPYMWRVRQALAEYDVGRHRPEW